MPRGLSLGLLLLLVAAGLDASPARAQSRDPRVSWRTLDTPHFVIHYHVPLGALARRVAVVAERAHTTLAPILGYEANHRTYIVLSDGTDDANGSAIALPFNVIRLNAAAPDALSPLSDYDDWLNMLVTHEHTHILHLDNWSGVATLINLLLGRTYAPNHVLPRWVLEGIATWQETERTAGGRVRGTQFDMYLRMDALEGRLLDLDQVSTSVDRWPHGNVWYLYGSHFITYIANRFGREAIATFIDEYGGETVPWGLNRIARRATGHDFIELYDDFRAERRAHYEAQRQRVLDAGLAEGERLTNHGEVARLPRFMPDGRIAYWRADNRDRDRVQAFSLDAPMDQSTLARVSGDPGLAIHPSGRAIVYSRTDNHLDVYRFHDLVREDLETGRVDRLTHGARAREPDISPDGRRVVYTVNEASTTHLMLAELRDVEGTARRILTNPRFGQVFNPRFSPDGRTIAFSRWERGGYRDVQLMDLASGEITRVTHDRALDTGPTWAPDGRTLYFSSDRTGIANIYAYSLTTGRLSQVTNVIGGAYQPVVSPDGRTMIFVGYTSFGFDLYRFDLGASTSRPAPSYVDRRPSPTTDDTMWNGPSRDYQAIESLWPRSYFLGLTDNGFGPAVSVTAAAEDLIEQHSWSIRATSGLTDLRMNVDATYAYRGAPLAIDARLFRFVTPRGGFLFNGEDARWIEEAVGGELAVAYTLPEAFQAQSVSATYRGTYGQNEQPFPTHFDPNTAPPEYPVLGYRSELRLGWSYSDVERYGYDISPSNGRAFGFSLSVSDPVIGSRYRAIELTWFFRFYARMPWLQHHVVAFNLTGGISGGELQNRGTFSIGGFGDANPIDGLINQSILGGTALRGYPAFDRSGNQYHLAQLEYRFPVFRINHGILTLPVFLNRLSAVVFADVGDAFFGEFDITTFRVGVGGAFLLDFTIGYLLPFTLRFGYARGLMDGGIDQFFGHLGVPF
ncbi:MAG: hypothetical protein AB7S26_19980 [Sandaracinaceae bacterium]